MSEKVIENGRVCVIGEVVSGFTFSREVFGRGLYLMDMAVNRLNDQAGIIPLTISRCLININENYEDCTVEARGQFRLYNRHEEAKNRLIFSIFVREITFMEEFMDYTEINRIFLDGYVCKVPIYRKTPLGCETADLLMTVNRLHKKSDYTPYIARGKNARYASGSEMGAHMKLWGKVQNREYTRKISDDECERKIVYEVPVNKLESGEMEMREEMQPPALSGT